MNNLHVAGHKYLFRANLLSSVSLIAAICASSFSVNAETVADQPGVYSVEEITVTARRRAERLQDTPVAVTALGALALEERHVQSTSEITNFAPNVQFDSSASESGGGSSSQISIRGIGQTDYTITVEPGVGLYLDGVYIGKSMGSLMDSVDLNQIEVLRGPQGTLFGKNTIGGAILLTSKRPGNTPESTFDVTTGRYNRLDVKASLNMPVNDRFRMRFSGAVLTRDGHVTRILTGDHQGNKNAVTGRLVAEYDLTENLLATLAVDGTRTREQSPGQVVVKVDENAFFAGLHNSIGFPACNPATPDNTGRFTDTDCANSQYARPINSLQSTNTGPNQSDTDVWGTHLALDWSLGDMSIKSISAYRHSTVNVFQELIGIPTYESNIGQHIKLRQISQEFQLSGHLADGRLTYLAGLFYMNEKGNQVFPVNLEPVHFTSGGSIDNNSYAAFGQTTYKVTDALSLTLGARYSIDNKKYRPEQQIDSVSATYQPFFDFLAGATGNTFLVQPGLPLFPRIWVSREDKQFTPSATLDYRFTKEVLGYFTYSKGFKGGGFTMRGFPPIIPGVTTPVTDPKAVIPTFGPETAEVFEIGLKSELLDRRVRLNLAGFWTNYKNLQLTANAGVSAFVPVLINAGDARIKGVELETEIIAADWLRLNGSVGYLDSKYRRLSADAIAAGASLDKHIPISPKWSLSLGATADLMNNDNGRVYVRGDYAYKSAQFKTVANDPELRQGAFGVLNASLTYESVKQNWSASIGGTNLTDKIYIVSGVANGGLGYSQAVVSRPREWFLNLKYKY